jgi:xylulokinase
MSEDLFLGLDLSTQSLTALVLGPTMGIREEVSIDFDHAYPHYGTHAGVPASEDPLQIHVDPLLWLEALDDMLGKLQEKRLTGRIAAIAVSAQQHGTVYLNERVVPTLAGLNPLSALHTGLSGIFSRPTCPIWMDSSTERECLEITRSLGGEAAVIRLTGSAATERFAGPQIRKFWKRDPGAYGRTEHIALISSFVTTVLTGRLAPLDCGDGYGTNLADIRTGDWSEAAMEAAAPGLRRRLPRLMRKDERIGRVSPYVARRFGFRLETEVVVGSGDNPCSLVGLGLIGVPDLHAVSLGTSDTYFGYMPELADAERTEGHIFGAADGRYMFLVCFKNGSLARERIKDHFGLSWDDFSRILLETASGNHGRIMLPYFMPEITPPVLRPRVWRFGGLEAEDVAGNVRAVAEAQAMAMYLHSGWTGLRPQTILVTAGGSGNPGLLTVISQVFGAEVRTLEVKESAALGAAIRAAHARLNRYEGGVSWRELREAGMSTGSSLIARPAEEAVRIYQGPGGLLEVYAACERFALGKGPDPEEPIKAYREHFCGP